MNLIKFVIHKMSKQVHNIVYKINEPYNNVSKIKIKLK